MSNLREIKKRISSVKTTEQITRTMEMVATAKIRRALNRAKAAEPYKTALTDVMFTVANDASNLGEDNPVFTKHEVLANELVIAIASDRGLAGGFNVNVEREAERIYRTDQARGIGCQIVSCGRKPTEYFEARGIHPVLSYVGESADPVLEHAKVIAAYARDAYVTGAIDRITVIYHHAKNRVDQELRVEQLLPLDAEAVGFVRGPRASEKDAPKRVPSSFSFIPSADHVLDNLIPSYILTVIHQALIDSAAAEQGARRKAMHSATENATSIIATLTRTLNRVRQASITTELNEIVGGASALEDFNG